MRLLQFFDVIRTVTTYFVLWKHPVPTICCLHYVKWFNVQIWSLWDFRFSSNYQKQYYEVVPFKKEIKVLYEEVNSAFQHCVEHQRLFQGKQTSSFFCFYLNKQNWNSFKWHHAQHVTTIHQHSTVNNNQARAKQIPWLRQRVKEWCPRNVEKPQRL